MVTGEVMGGVGRDVTVPAGFQFALVTVEGVCEPLPLGSFLASLSRSRQVGEAIKRSHP